MIKYLFSTLFSVAAVALVASGYTAVEKKIKTCDQQYALCSAAQCIPNPENSDEAICFCVVKEGVSLGKIPCDQRIPFTDKQGLRHVVSTFSFGEAEKRVMTCPDGNPWTDCLDMPCTVDPLDPSKAICICKIKRSGSFVTYGGDCDQSTCKTGYWSGAEIESNAEFTRFLTTALKLKQSPVKFCPK